MFSIPFADDGDTTIEVMSSRPDTIRCTTTSQMVLDYLSKQGLAKTPDSVQVEKGKFMFFLPKSDISVVQAKDIKVV